MKYKAGDLLHNTKLDYYWLIKSVDSKMYYGRSSAMKNGRFIDISMGLHCDGEGMQVTEDAKIIYEHILNHNHNEAGEILDIFGEEVIESEFEFVTSLDENVFKEFIKKEEEFFESQPREYSESRISIVETCDDSKEEQCGECCSEQ